jgi:hypothetical protein
MKWLGVRRKARKFVQHNACCFGINHCRYGNNHELYMLDVALEEDPFEELSPGATEVSTGGEPV